MANIKQALIAFCLVAMNVGAVNYGRKHYMSAEVAAAGDIEIFHNSIASKSKASSSLVRDARQKRRMNVSWDQMKIPKDIYSSGANEGSFPYLKMWADMNPGWKVHEVINSEQRELIKDLFPGVSDLSEILLPVEITDIARLVALQNHGGFYIDSDVVEQVPIESWLSKFSYPGDVDMLLGVEFPREAPPNPIQINTWTFGSVAKNPILALAIDHIIKNVKSMSKATQNVVQRTGPGAFTAAILEAIKRGGAELPPMQELNGGGGHLFKLVEPDGSHINIALLPYRAMGYHPMHGSDVEKEPYSEHLVHHQFKGSWQASANSLAQMNQ